MLKAAKIQPTMFSRRSCTVASGAPLRYTGHTIRKPGWTSRASSPGSLILLETATPAVSRACSIAARREGSAK